MSDEYENIPGVEFPGESHNGYNYKIKKGYEATKIQAGQEKSIKLIFYPCIHSKISPKEECICV